MNPIKYGIVSTSKDGFIINKLPINAITTAVICVIDIFSFKNRYEKSIWKKYFTQVVLIQSQKDI